MLSQRSNHEVRYLYEALFAAKNGVGDRDGLGNVHIDAINIHTDSKDPREHGRLVGAAIKSHAIATQANTGLN